MAIAGLRGTGDFATDERPQNFRELILWRDPNGSAPLTALMAKMRKETTDQPEFNWWEEEQKAIRVKLGASVSSATATTFTLDTNEEFAGLDLVAGDVLLVEITGNEPTSYSFELVEVAADPTSNGSITVTRGAAGSTALSSIANGTYLLKIGSAHEEGSGAPKASSRNPTKYTNFTQIFKTVYDLTGTAEQSSPYTGDPVKNDKKRKAFDHAVAMEWAALFGRPDDTATGSNGKPKRYTGGLYYYLSLNYDATSKPTIQTLTKSSATEDDVLDALYGMWDYNVPESGNERIAFCGNGFLNSLNKIANKSSSTRINYDGTIKVYGMELMKWVLPQGTIYLRTHPLMSTHSYFTDGAFIINPPGIRWRPMRNRDTKFKDNVQLPDEDRRKGLWQTEGGFEFNHLRSMRYVSIR